MNTLPVNEYKYHGNKHKSKHGTTGDDDICGTVLCDMKQESISVDKSRILVD